MTPRPAVHRQGVFVLIALLVYAVMALVAASGESNTFDEPLHITGGYTYWRLNDYRIQPENGNWPERLAGLPTAIRGAHFAPPSDTAWLQAFTWKVSDEFFYKRGNDARTMLMWGRAMITIVGMVLGAVIFGWASRLSGTAGGWVSLIIYVFSPTFLAHGALATSDVTAALFFVAASWSLWIVLHRITIRTTLVSVFCLSGLFLSKFSAVLFLPMAFIMLVVRMIRRTPLTMGTSDSTAAEVPQSRVTERMIGLIVVHAVGVFFMIWASYGFRYSLLGSTPMADPTTDGYWARVESPSVQSRYLINGMRSAHVLPEGWLYGMQHVLSHEDDRPAFLNGTFYHGGKLLFFPYAALVKTTIPALIILILTPIFLRARWRNQEDADHDAMYRGLYALTPLIALVGLYWLAALHTQLNIGHRHLLPALAGTTVFFGAAGDSVTRLIARLRNGIGPATTNWGWGAAVALLLAWHAAESVKIYPHYLAYFNELDGGPSEAWKHLNDSSLDWGQDVPALKQWLDDQGLQKPGHQPVFFSYFGSADPQYYHLDVEQLPGPVDRVGWRAPPDLLPGVYCISATMLNAVYLAESAGPWTAESERKYQEDSRALAMFAAAYNDKVALHKLIASAPDGAWATTFKEFERLRFGRLAATLRRRDPDDQVGYSILIYRVTAEELRRALDGPPPFGGATP